MRSCPLAAATVTLLIRVGVATAVGSSNEQHAALGQNLKFHHSFSAAQELSRGNGKPIILLFTELGRLGSQVCQDFGKESLTHAAVVDLLGDEFVAVSVNNAVVRKERGENDQTLARFAEHERPGHAVIRFVDAEGSELAPRLADPDADAVVRHALAALARAGRELPAYARSMAIPLREQQLFFSAQCFWTAEAHMGRLAAATSAQAIWLPGRGIDERGRQDYGGEQEGLRFGFDPSLASADEIVVAAAALGFVHIEEPLSTVQEAEAGAKNATTKTWRLAQPSDHLHCIGLKREPRYDAVQLTARQAMVANSACFHSDVDGYPLLSPTQQKQLNAVDKKEDL
jgi:hypothetical protein